MEVLFKNVQIIDGTGKPPYKGSVGISDGKTVLSGLPEQADWVIDGNLSYQNGALTGVRAGTLIR